MTSLIMIIFIIATLIGNSAANKEKHKDKCNIFMAPSLIKERDQQGYGLGLFTGKILFEGQDINWNEVLLRFMIHLLLMPIIHHYVNIYGQGICYQNFLS